MVGLVYRHGWVSLWPWKTTAFFRRWTPFHNYNKSQPGNFIAHSSPSTRNPKYPQFWTTSWLDDTHYNDTSSMCLAETEHTIEQQGFWEYIQVFDKTFIVTLTMSCRPTGPEKPWHDLESKLNCKKQCGLDGDVQSMVILITLPAITMQQDCL